LISVQRREPWLFNNWFIINQRWEFFPDLDFLANIDLWVQIRGIPMPYVCVETVSEIAQELGHIVLIDFQEATSNQIAYIRVRVRFGITDRLRFFQRIRFDSGETAIIRFQYERLRRICSRCLRFTHQRNHCPYMVPLPAPRNDGRGQDMAERTRAALHEELCRSDMNSQSQLSDDSFPAPITPPPRTATPPLNSAELAAARLYLFPSRTATPQNLMVEKPQMATLTPRFRSESHLSPPIADEVTSRFSRILEIGESSRRAEIGEGSRPTEEGDSSKRKTTQVEQPEAVRRNQKQKVTELKEGGILKPPKKR